jgi:hypothetical protein
MRSHAHSHRNGAVASRMQNHELILAQLDIRAQDDGLPNPSPRLERKTCSYTNSRFRSQ